MESTSLITLSFKGQRKYLQGSDILNAVLSKYGTNISSLVCTFHSMVFSNTIRIEVFDEIKKNDCSADIKFLINGVQKRIKVFEEETSEPVISVDYDENIIQDNSFIAAKEIVYSEASPYSYLETVVSLNKKLLNSVLDNTGKWLFTRYDSKIFNLNQKVTAIKIDKCFNLKLVRSAIYNSDERVGDLYFTRIEQ